MTRPLTRRTPLRRRPPHARPATRPPQPPAPARCALCGRLAVCHQHHRLRRSQGGTDAHLVPLCPDCHIGVVHAYPDWAYRHRWLLHAWSEPGPPIVCDLDCDRDHTTRGEP